MPSSYPAAFDPIPFPAWDEALGQPARTAESFLTDIVDSIKAVQQSVGTSVNPGPLLARPGDLVLGGSDFPVDKTGLTDASAAVQDWVDAVIAAKGTGYAPPGDYLLMTAITASGLSQARFSLIGAGLGLTRFIVPASNTTGAFILQGTGSGRAAKVEVRDLSIMTRGVAQGTGFQFNIDASSNLHQRSIIMRDVHIYGENAETDCFDIGINLTHTERPLVYNVIVSGPYGASTASEADDSPKYAATAALVLDNAYGWHVENCHLWSAHTLLRDVGSNAEGGRLVNSQLVSGRVAMEYSRTGREPGIAVINSHWSYRDTGLLLDGVLAASITGCHPYNIDTANEGAPGTARDIWLKNAEEVSISGNIFHFVGPDSRINVDIDSTVYADEIQVAGNIFNSGGQNAIRVGAAASNVSIGGWPNKYMGTYTKNVLDNSGIAAILDVHAGSYRLSSQSSSGVAGPAFRIKRDSSSPAANDDIGVLRFLGNDSALTEVEYATLAASILDPTAGGEDAALAVWAQLAGTLTKAASFNPVMTSNSTAMLLLVNSGGTVSLQRVSLGATDSGGTGFKVLRVPN